MAKKTGRPTLYTAELAEKICEGIAGGESLRQVCTQEGMPEERTVYRWLWKQPEFCQNYARAREYRADYLAEEALAIADDDSKDILQVGEGGDIRSLTNSAAVQRSKLQFEARKWAASQMAPKKWGKQQVQHTGEDGGPIKTIVNVMLKKQPGAVDE